MDARFLALVIEMGEDTIFAEAKFVLLLRKEVIQPHLPVRLPCYDLVPVTSHTFADVPLAVRQAYFGYNQLR